MVEQRSRNWEVLVQSQVDALVAFGKALITTDKLFIKTITNLRLPLSTQVCNVGYSVQFVGHA